MKMFIRKNKVFCIIIVLFIISTVFAYFYMYTPSYSSLENAIKISSRGGEETARYKFDHGYFIYFKNSHLKYEYYYPKNKKWYNKGIISTKNYNLDDKYKVTIYYVQRNKISFILVQDMNNSTKSIKYINDSIETKFDILSTSKKNSFFFGGTYEKIPEDYSLIIDGKEYMVKEYNELFKLFQ